MINPVRLPAKIMKAVELYRLLEDAKEFAANSGQVMRVSLVFNHETKSIDITPTTNLTNAIQPWLRSTGDALDAGELRQVEDLARSQKDKQLSIGERMQKVSEDFNLVSQRWRLARISAFSKDSTANDALFTFNVPEKGKVVEPDYSAQWKSLRDYCYKSQLENREFLINNLYQQMDALLLNLKEITSKELQIDGHFDELLSISNGLYELIEQEKHYHESGFISQTGHVNAGLIGFASVLRDAAAAIGESPSMLPQRHVLSTMAASFERGTIPNGETLRGAYDAGERHVIDVGAFRGNFLGAMAHARKDPVMLFSNICDTAKIAKDKTAHHFSINFQKEFDEMAQMVHSLQKRYKARNDEAPGMKQFLDQLGTLETNLEAASQPDFNPNAAHNKHFFANLYMYASRASESYTKLQTNKVASLELTYKDYAAEGTAGQLQWLAEVIDEVNSQHPVFSVTHIPSLYHRALLSALESDTLASLQEAPKDTAQARYMHEVATELTQYLRTGKIGDSRILETSAEEKSEYFRDLGDRLAHVDAGHDVLMASTADKAKRLEDVAYGVDVFKGHMPPADDSEAITNSATIVAKDSAVMQPDVLEAPTPVVVAGELSEIDRMIASAHAADTTINGGAIIRGDAVFADGEPTSHAEKVRPGGKGDSFAQDLKISNAFGYEDPVTR